MNRILISISCVLVAVACRSTIEPGNQTLEMPDLIRRNLFRTSDEFRIEEASVYQYGNIQVDGPTGGMLYRFVTTPEALEWLVSEWSLESVAITSAGDLPFDFLADAPQWWRPGSANVDAYYVTVEEFAPRGRRTLIVVPERRSDVLYVSEHFEDMVGI